VGIVVAFVLRRTVTGRWIYASGGNRRAAQLAGIPVTRVVIGVYAVAGLIAAIAGVVAAARFNTARSDFADGSELDAITAAILGGVAIAGGRGSVVWALLGALALAVLRNGLTLLGYSGFVQIVAIGLILISAAVADRLVSRHRLRREVSLLLGRRPPAGQVVPANANEGGSPS
jgi:ribose/xylose/arabinose/galactoside ABC-type transport system permease subunit